MKLHILSDLHLGVQDMAQPATSADVVILAGDISRPERAAPWALAFDKPVIYVIGNHEFYGSSLPEVKAAFHRLFDGTHVHLLDDSAVELGGVRFLGSPPGPIFWPMARARPARPRRCAPQARPGVRLQARAHRAG